MIHFSSQTMQDILVTLSQKINLIQTKELVEFDVINPDILSGKYSGEHINIDSQTYIYRTYKSWLDLSHILGCRFLTPIVIDENLVKIRYQKLNPDESFHNKDTDKEQKYGKESIFNQIHKNEESSFLHYYKQALDNVNIQKRKHILNLGVNSGDEFEVIINSTYKIDDLNFVGIDYTESAIDEAKEKFKNYPNFTFFKHDINELDTLKLEKSDLIITIGTLQSSNLEFNKLLMSIVQNQLKKDGAMILGFPNCRWIDGEMVYGARVKNYPFSELGLLYKDVMFAKKYLQQKKYRVTITGKDYIFLTATSIRS